MIFALLVKFDGPKHDSYYGSPILRTVFKTGIVKASAGHMRMSLGDE